MANYKSILSESYNYVTVLLRLDETNTTDTLLDAETLSYFDPNVPNSSDIQLRFYSANFSLGGHNQHTTGFLKILREHQTTDALIMTLTGTDQIQFSPSLPVEHPAGLALTGFNGDIKYEASSNTIGYAVITFEKKGGFYMTHNKWRKPTQNNPYSS